MARIRTIKPDFWSDGKIVTLSAAARLLFIGSWNFALCDDGHLPDDAMGLKLKVLPADAVDPFELLQELLDAGVIVQGETADGRSYLHVPRLRDHQKVDNRWTPRCFVCTSQNPAEPQPASTKPAETRASFTEPPRDSSEPTAVKERKGKEVLTSDESDEPDLFADFYDAYPRKEARRKAEQAWRAATKRTDPAVIMAGLEKFQFSEDRRFVPLPASWLNAERWADETSNVRPINGNSSTTGRRQQVMIGPDYWRDVSGDEVTIGRKTRWV
jgi:hypothetical protein